MNERICKKIVSELYAIPRTNVYAILDGASVPRLLNKFVELKPEHECLYRGELSPHLQRAAPYIVQLERSHPFTRWIIKEGWGNHWGIFAISGADLDTMRHHFRTFLSVKSPEGKKLYFRYYDPRLLRLFLPKTDQNKRDLMFGPLNAYLCEGQDAKVLLKFRNAGTEASTTSIALPSTQDIYGD